MVKWIKRFLIGRPLKNEALEGEKLGILFGLPILSSDAISSVAYAGQEILIVLIPAVGVAAYGQLTAISAGIIALMVILVLSYRQTIDSYPSGGGAYIVAKDNIGVLAGVTAGGALAVNYVLTVAVSVASGVEQITSTWDFLEPYSVEMSVILILLLMLGNLRGIRESAKIFAFPAYAFALAILGLIIAGFVKLKLGYVPAEPKLPATHPLTAMLALKAFSCGCAALTGVEAISNAVPNFRNPPTKYAKRVLVLLGLTIVILFGGTSLLANVYHVVPGENALLILIAREVFGEGAILYFIAATIFIILVLAANTAYTAFPMLISIMAKEGFAPRQLALRGDRLSYDNGIIALSAVAILLIVAFKASVSSLIGLYAIGVFISFSLSQSGMLIKWLRTRTPHWQLKAFINGLGAFVTSIVVVIIAFTKFHEGSWLVVVLMPILVYSMLKIKKHYMSVHRQLKLEPEQFEEFETQQHYNNRIIVPIDSINKKSIRALKYAQTISPNVTAFSVVIDEEAAEKLREKFEWLKTDIPLIIKYSPFRKVVEPLVKYIESTEYEYQRGDIITVILPQFGVRRWWHRFLHNNSLAYIEKQLLRHKHIVVSVMPLQLKDDDVVMGHSIHPDVKFPEFRGWEKKRRA